MKKFLRLFLITISLFCTISACTSQSSNNKNHYDTINFGSKNGIPVSWYIVHDDGKHYILFSEKVLDVKQYNTTNEVTHWEDTYLHEYLNTDFINEYFSDEEKNRMVFTNDQDDDLVTMPSINNLIDLFGELSYVKDGYYGNDDFFAANPYIIAKPADAALDNDIYPFNNKEYAEIEQIKIDKRYDFADGASPYWLLNQSEDGLAYSVTGTGYISVMEPTYGYIGFRPIIRVKKS